MLRLTNKNNVRVQKRKREFARILANLHENSKNSREFVSIRV